MTEKEKTNQVDIEDEINALKQAKIIAASEHAKSHHNTIIKIADLCDLLGDLAYSMSETANDEQNQHLVKIKQYLEDWAIKERETDANKLYDFKVETTPGLVRGDIDGTKQ